MKPQDPDTKADLGPLEAVVRRFRALEVDHRPDGFPVVMMRDLTRLVDAFETARVMLKEVRQWHADPDSSDYNECDTEPCSFCETSKLLTDPNF